VSIAITLVLDNVAYPPISEAKCTRKNYRIFPSQITPINLCVSVPLLKSPPLKGFARIEQVK
jgi:hypothetical protein